MARHPARHPHPPRSRPPSGGEGTWELTTDSALEALREIRDRLAGLHPHFIDMPMEGLVLPSNYEAKWNAWIIEAYGITDEALGLLNNVSVGLQHVHQRSRMSGGPSVLLLEEAEELLELAIRTVARKGQNGPGRVLSPAPARLPFVSPVRIGALRTLKSSSFDFTRLARMCEELNLAHEAGALLALAMLQRAIVDHVPPVFGVKSFAEVVNNYSGGRSFSEQMRHLESSMRKIGDAHLHGQIRSREDLPTEQQVNFSAAIDVLLGEVIRLSK